MKLTFGFSPCPNDTFMFDAIFNKRIDLQGLDITCILEDVEYLNKAAFNNKFDITKISFNAITKLTESYQLLHSGSALGRNCGPLLISKRAPSEIEVNNASIAIPGIHTTANFLLSYAYPKANRKKEVLFSEVESYVSSGKTDLGLIIHENRFTYLSKGLHKVLDLGEFWEAKTGFPIPLGGIAVKRNLPDPIKKKVNQILSDSVAYAFEHRQLSKDFIKTYAQEMSDDVISSHIALYVNNFSLDINEEGKNAVYNLFRVINGSNFRKEEIFL